MGAAVLEAEQRHRLLLLVGVELRDFKSRRPHPGQRWRHGWIPTTYEMALRYHNSLAGLEDIADAVESGEDDNLKLPGGLNSEVRYVEHKNGGETIEKRPDDAGQVFGHDGPTAEEQSDAEQLASTLGRSIGAPVPRVLRTGPEQVNMSVAEGKKWSTLRGEAMRGGTTYPEIAAQLDQIVATNDGTRLGLFDLLIGNWDRNNPTNWLADADGNPTGIDHAYAWANILGQGSPTDLSEYEGMSPFSRAFVGGSGSALTFKDNPLTASDIEYLRGRLAAVEADFDKLGHHDWWEFAAARLDAIAAHARGTEPIFT
jgi:hypothetical protein